MRTDNLKKTIVSLALTGSFLIGAGAFSATSAQDRRYQRQRANCGQVDRNGNIDCNRNGIDDRYEVNGKVDRNQNGIPDQNERAGRRGYNNYRYNDNNYRYNGGVRQVGYYDRFGRFHATGYYDAYGRFHRY